MENESTSTSSRISALDMERIVQMLLTKQHRDSTTRNYLSVWRQFNKFLINLDKKPKLWEDRTMFFWGYLIDKGMQSSSIKSYVSAIKKTLVMDGYGWNDKLVLVQFLAKACRIINDKVRTRLPIHCNLLGMILFEIQRYFRANGQCYLEKLYLAMFAISYYSLMRIGEVTESPHVLKASNAHIASNKDKLLLILYSSKTHGKANRPQKIKITSNKMDQLGHYINRHFCPFKLMRDYITVHGDYNGLHEQFFVFGDHSPVRPNHARALFKLVIQSIGLDSQYYGMHSFRVGRTSDLIKFHFSFETVKMMGRWKSNIIYKYMRS